MKKFFFLCLISCLSIGAMDITDLDKKEVLRALFAVAKPQGYGHSQYKHSDTLTNEEIEGLAKSGFYIDYLKGRVMKINLSTNIVDTRLYNRDNGPEAAEKAIAHLRK